MDIMDKAKELGQMIAESDQYKRLVKAEIAQTNDSHAQQMIKEYNEKRKQVAENMKNKEMGPEDLEAFKNELQNAFNQLLKNVNIKEYIEAKKDFEQMMQSVNSIISYYVTGEEQSGCASGSCDSCSGCH